MKAAYEAGWPGGVMKTAFDGVPIHIPGEYMHVFDDYTYGNFDNVSGHSLDRVCGEVEKLIRMYPDRITMASTGGPVTGDDAADRAGWQGNTRKLESAGVLGIEYSLSCPQGGDGTEGDIVSQNAALTAKIVDWVMEVSDPDVPKLFKLTGAVTSIAAIMNAIKEVLDRYPGKKAGVTLANTFPTMIFRAGRKPAWEEGIVVGMSGEGITPISNLTLANAVGAGIAISGNGGPMDYKAAADFLALGAHTVQFCSLVMKYGYGVIDTIEEGVSQLMLDRGIPSMEELIGRALPGAITDFMDLPAEKAVSDVHDDLCLSCGNCTRCPYLAITLNEDKHPRTDASKCIGCGFCAMKCFSGALYLRERTEEEAAALKEG
jgi:dihydropyrimidine dehydrogenase (NAD+) subunit PreA